MRKAGEPHSDSGFLLFILAIKKEGKMKKILVIDDEKPTLSMFGLFLGAMDFDVATAENGTTGIELFKKERPDIVLTDIKMPGMDGLEVLKKLKEIDPSIPVIVVTGHGDTALEQKALSLNASGFIHKPIDREEIEKVLNRV